MLHKNQFILFVYMLTWLFHVSCNTSKPDLNKPNILWLTCEDISPMLACYGDSTAKTPNIDKLASESMVFTNVYSTVGVCGPARSSIITGMYPSSIGTHHMRTGRDYSAWGSRNYSDGPLGFDINGDTIPLYSAVIPAYVKCFTEYLRASGYYCTNNVKTDYQFAAPVTAWDENSNTAHWKNTPAGMSFFSVFNHEITHESRIWMNKDQPMTVNPDSVALPDYFPDNEIVRIDVARCYSNIELLDMQVGEKLNELEAAGLLENTIIFFYSDHGGPLPRGKRESYVSGLKVPFMVRFPKGEHAGRYNNLISFVDLAPTILSLAGIKPPDYLQGQAFLGKYKSTKPREYIFGSGDRFDEFADQIRSVSDGEFLYVRNFHPELPRYKDVGYRKNMDMMNELLALKDAGKLSNKQNIWFEKTKPKEELYDCELDPYQLNNIAMNSNQSEKLNEFRRVLANWQKEIDDKGNIPERVLLEQMWPGGTQPITANPSVKIENGMLRLECFTKGASIAYIISDQSIEADLNSGWKLYSKPMKIEKEKIVYALANRIGFADSEIIELKY